MTPEQLQAAIDAEFAALQVFQAEAAATTRANIATTLAAFHLGASTYDIHPGDSLTAALASGKALRFRPGRHLHGLIARTGLRLTFDAGAELVGGAAPALTVPPGVHDVHVTSAGMFRSDNTIAILLGLNTSAQNTLDAVPRGLRLDGVHVPTHRGKRAFEINCGDSEFQSCGAFDVYDPGGQDSQPFGVLNSPGGLTFRDCHMEGGKESFMAGGDPVKVPGMMPTGLLFERCTFAKDPTWRFGGPSIKNLFELKNARNVLLRHCTLKHCWQSGQTGFAFVLTPGAGGGIVHNVTIEDCTVTDVANGIQVTGRQDASWTPERTGALTFRRMRLQVDCSLVNPTSAQGLFGRLLQFQQEPSDIGFDDITFLGNVGSTLIYGDDATVMGEDGVPRQAVAPGYLSLVGSRLALRETGSYGISLNGQHNASNLSWFTGGTGIYGNTFGGSTAMQNRLPPGNTFLPRPQFDAAYPLVTA